MSKFGLGMIAANAAIDEQKAQELRDQTNQRFDWEKQRAQSELSLLGDKAAAERSQYQNTVGANAAAAELRPQETANKKAQLGNDATKIAGETKRLPGLEQAKDSEAVAAAGAAKVKEALQGVEVERIPSMVADAKMKGAINDATSMNLVGATIADLIDSGNQAGLVKLLNAQKQYAGDPKTAALPDVASVAKARDANGQEMLVLKDETGNVIMSRPISIYQAARDSLKKQEVKEVKEGHSLVSVRGNTVTPLYTAPPSDSSRAAKMGPLERDVNYLVSGHGMSKEQALAHLQSAKTMSRENFILKAVENAQAMGKKVTDAELAEFGAIYDRAAKGTPPASPPTQPATGPADPKVSAAIRYPSGQATRPATAPPGLSQVQATAPPPAPAPAPAAPAAPATQQPANMGAPLSQRLAQAVQADSQSGGGRNFAALADEVMKSAPAMQQQLQSLKTELPYATGSQRQFIESKIAELERDLTMAQGIINQAKAQRGY